MIFLLMSLEKIYDSAAKQAMYSEALFEMTAKRFREEDDKRDEIEEKERCLARLHETLVERMNEICELEPNAVNKAKWKILSEVVDLIDEERDTCILSACDEGD